MSVTLDVDGVNSEGLMYDLFNEYGKCVVSKTLTEQSCDISFNFLQPSTYFLLIKNQKKETLKTFKISRI